MWQEESILTLMRIGMRFVISTTRKRNPLDWLLKRTRKQKHNRNNLDKKIKMKTKKIKDTGYCNHCREMIPTGDACVISQLPIDIPSAKKGGSAIVCADCYIIIMTTEVPLVDKYEDIK